jgi:ABC-3C protein
MRALGITFSVSSSEAEISAWGPRSWTLGKSCTSQGKFTLPEQFTFVAPRGLARPLEDLIFKPDALKQAMLDNWTKYCETQIEKGKTISMDAQLLAHIKAFDFSCVDRCSLDDILTDPAAKPALAAMFGADPGSPPLGVVPPTVAPGELRYADALMRAYGERDNCNYGCHDDIIGHDVHGKHFFEQRERFYAADAFSRFYRDNTLAEELSALEDEMYHGIVEKHREVHADSLTRVNAVMSQAAAVLPSGPLARHARVQVRQGVCHHFVNNGRIASWTP